MSPSSPMVTVYGVVPWSLKLFLAVNSNLHGLSDVPIKIEMITCVPVNAWSYKH
jgi:hypothetical protein